jgi:inosine-uridine nucleoside N-ribohydrolase
MIHGSARLQFVLSLLLSLLTIADASGQQRRKIIINEDCSGPGGSNMQTVAMLVQSRQVEVVGITVVSGDQWRDEEVAHTLRLLEILGRPDIPVIPGAVFPLVRSREESQLWQGRFGKVAYAGAWDERWWHEPFVVPPLPEGAAGIKASNDDAAHFIIKMVRRYPHEVTIYEGGPMTNLAVAIRIDPSVPQLAEELVFMGGSLAPQTDYAEFATNPRHEFNLWFDPEAAEMVLRAPWRKIVCTPVDISIKARLTPQLVKEIEAAGTPLARYVAQFYQQGMGADFMWDELAAGAWLEPDLITKVSRRFMSVDIDHGPAYGNTLTWTEADKPNITAQAVDIQVEFDAEKFYRIFVKLMTAGTTKPQ